MKSVDFTIYDKNTGEIKLSGNCGEDYISLQSLPLNCILIQEKSNHKTQYVENGKIVDMPEKPDEFCEFNYLTKQWVQNESLTANNVKVKRDIFLYQSDWTQLPNNPLTPEKQQQWADYRQQLRDIPQQQGYPFNVVWPTKPT